MQDENMLTWRPAKQYSLIDSKVIVHGCQLCAAEKDDYTEGDTHGLRTNGCGKGLCTCGDVLLKVSVFTPESYHLCENSPARSSSLPSTPDKAG